MNNNYKCGLYIRLSKEDEIKNNTDSESVSNQKELLVKYSKDNNYNVYDIYIDDGYTGTNFNRPGFNKMIEDIKNNKINMVIVKDLSRLGRDYIETGKYIEKWFPENNVRFISILDNIDTLLDNSNNEFIPFKTIINDFYSRENSKKIKAALRTKQLNGKWVGGCTPFGYMTDPKDKNHLIINKEEATIVKRIFDMALSTYSINKIINVLNEEKIKTPALFRNIKKNTLGCWNRTTIKTILKNELYTGNLVQNRRNKINYKIRKLKLNKKDDWIIIKNTHEKIIDEKDFEEVNRLLKLNGNTKSNKKNKTILDGVLYCGECKKKLIIQKNKNKKYLMCNTYKKYSKLKLCSSHSNNYLNVEKNVLSQLKKELDKIDINLLYKKIRINNKNNNTKELNIKIENNKNNLDNLYLDKLNNKIDEEMFNRLFIKINNEIDLLKKEISNYSYKPIDIKEEVVNSLININNNQFINKLIKRIEIHQDKTLDIYFNFKMI
ncbi:MAG: recombinase family protein [Bacilli bacterium]|nr:recombinase family protein [Bacilli bacterium]